MNIKIYGSRGSMPFFSRDNLRYGGNTACVRIDTGGHTVILDCGSGLAQFQSDLEAENKTERLSFDILLGHLHLDHIIGLSTFRHIIADKNNIRIFTKSRDNRSLSSQIFGVFKPPYWPVDLEAMNRAEIVEISGKAEFMMNEGIKVTPFPAIHPDDTTAFRIESEGKSVVYLLDYEMSETLSATDALVRYCNLADIIIFDSTFLPEDYERKKGWGHSTYESGVILAKLSGCKHMIFSHFDQNYSDQTIDSLEHSIKECRFTLAYDGLELTL